MKKIITTIISCIMIYLSLAADEIRPIRDKTGYCWEKNQLNRLMDHLGKSAGNKRNLNLIAGISPHDDFLYAGRVYFSLFRNIKCKEVIIFGVSHSSVRKKLRDPQKIIILDNYKSWQGPFKLVMVSDLREIIKKRLNKKFYLVSNTAHDLEHSIEGMIPFLQYFNPEVKITPIMVTAMNFKDMRTISQQLADIFAYYISSHELKIGKDIFFLISSDANHYGEYFNNTAFGHGESGHKLGTAYDKEISQRFLIGQLKETRIRDLSLKLWRKDVGSHKNTLWCGRYSIPFGLLTVLNTVNKVQKGKKVTGRFIVYSDTYSEGVLPLKKPGFGITAPFSPDRWVGFFSAGFSLD